MTPMHYMVNVVPVAQAGRQIVCFDYWFNGQSYAYQFLGDSIEDGSPATLEEEHERHAIQANANFLRDVVIPGGPQQ